MGDDAELFERLREVRREISAERELPAYMVCTAEPLRPGDAIGPMGAVGQMDAAELLLFQAAAGRLRFRAVHRPRAAFSFSGRIVSLPGVTLSVIPDRRDA